MSLSIVILAAGKGTRMQSDLPKVLHHAAGQPLLQHVINSASELDGRQLVVVVGHGAEQVKSRFKQQSITFVDQIQQLGTGHAVQQCKSCLIHGDDVLVLYGDVPLITPQTLENLCNNETTEAIRILSFESHNPTGYGRIIRSVSGQVEAIREHRDCDADELEITECNSGILWVRGTELKRLLEKLENNNQQKEFYLTDIVAHAVEEGLKIEAIKTSEEEVIGVNNQLQLAEVESVLRTRQAEALMLKGVKLIDPTRIDIRGEISVGKDVIIDSNCIFEGNITLEDGVKIGANCVLKDCYIGKESIVHPMSLIDSSHIGQQVQIGPMARIRPDTQIEDKARIGNFVEIKKSRIGYSSKINHLSYIGDTQMGSEVNIGAGCITCNYDGVNKHQTRIGNRVFVGSDTQIIAPVELGDDATIGAGSTITKDAPANELSLSRSKQSTIKGWIKPARR